MNDNLSTVYDFRESIRSISRCLECAKEKKVILQVVKYLDEVVLPKLSNSRNETAKFYFSEKSCECSLKVEIVRSRSTKSGTYRHSWSWRHKITNQGVEEVFGSYCESLTELKMFGREGEFFSPEHNSQEFYKIRETLL